MISDGLSLTSSVGAIQYQASLLTLSKTLKVEREAGAQLLQGLPQSGT